MHYINEHQQGSVPPMPPSWNCGPHWPPLPPIWLVQEPPLGISRRRHSRGVFERVRKKKGTATYMPLVINAETSAKVDELKICETSTFQPLSNVKQHRQTLSVSHQYRLYQQSLSLDHVTVTCSRDNHGLGVDLVWS